MAQLKGLGSLKALNKLNNISSSNLKITGSQSFVKQVPCMYLSTLDKHNSKSLTPPRETLQQQRPVHQGGYSGSHGNHGSSNKGKYLATTAFATAALGGATFAWLGQDENKTSQFKHEISKHLHQVGAVSAKSDNKDRCVNPGATRSDLPTFKAEDVAEHNSPEKGIWVTYKCGVYDISEYVAMHPGGKRIMMAAGKSIEPFWNLYSVHKVEEVFEQLEVFRIGNITYVPASKEAADANDPYGKEPERSPLLIPSSQKPFNAEPPQVLLAEKFITPNDLFFVRNHLPVPTVDIKDYKLELGLDKGSTTLSFEDLKTKFTKKAVTAVTQCAGNRRSEMVEIKPVKGLNWGSAAISNAKWAGVSLDDLLLHHGVDIDTVRGKYIIFEGMDKQPDDSPYGASIPLELARILKKDIIVAYEMNNAPIPRDHGYPVRVVIPGVVGARQVKWLNKIYFSGQESTSHWQRRDYKGFNSSIDWHNVDFDKSISISQLPVISAICEPEEGTVLEEGSDEVTVKGYAWSGGGRGIIRVDVSADGGATWQEARLKVNNQSNYKMWAWTLWEVDVALPKGSTRTQLICKAVDVSYNVQPDSVEGIWNLRGVLSNAWHRVNVTIPKGE